MKPKIAALLGLCLLAGCTNPLNVHTANRYYNLGVDAESSGDLERACMFFSRSYGNTVMGNAPLLTRAHALYEYARVSGYLGRLAEAEKGFNEVIVLLDKVANDPNNLRAPTHSEHAKLLFANRRYQESIPEFEKAITYLDKLSVESTEPGDYAVFLEDYAAALRAAQDSTQADTVAARVAKIRREHPNASVTPVRHKHILASDIPTPSPLVTPLTNSTGK